MVACLEKVFIANKKPDQKVPIYVVLLLNCHYDKGIF